MSTFIHLLTPPPPLPPPVAETEDWDDYLCETDLDDFDEHKPLCIGFEKFNLDGAAAAGGDGDEHDDDEKMNVGVRIAFATKFMMTHRPDKINADTTHNMFEANLKTTSLGFDDAEKQYHPVVEVVSTTETSEDYKFAMTAWAQRANSVRPFGEPLPSPDVPRLPVTPLYPTYLLADGAMAPRNAFKAVFPVGGVADLAEAEARALANTLMCRNHVICVSVKLICWYIHYTHYTKHSQYRGCVGRSCRRSLRGTTACTATSCCWGTVGQK